MSMDDRNSEASSSTAHRKGTVPSSGNIKKVNGKNSKCLRCEVAKQKEKQERRLLIKYISGAFPGSGFLDSDNPFKILKDFQKSANAHERLKTELWQANDQIEMIFENNKLKTKKLEENYRNAKDQLKLKEAHHLKLTQRIEDLEKKLAEKDERLNYLEQLPNQNELCSMLQKEILKLRSSPARDSEIDILKESLEAQKQSETWKIQKLTTENKILMNEKDERILKLEKYIEKHENQEILRLRKELERRENSLREAHSRNEKSQSLSSQFMKQRDPDIELIYHSENRGKASSKDNAMETNSHSSSGTKKRRVISSEELEASSSYPIASMKNCLKNEEIQKMQKALKEKDEQISKLTEQLQGLLINRDKETKVEDLQQFEYDGDSDG